MAKILIDVLYPTAITCKTTKGTGATHGIVLNTNIDNGRRDVAINT